MHSKAFSSMGTLQAAWQGIGLLQTRERSRNCSSSHLVNYPLQIRGPNETKTTLQSESLLLLAAIDSFTVELLQKFCRRNEMDVAGVAASNEMRLDEIQSFIEN